MGRFSVDRPLNHNFRWHVSLLLLIIAAGGDGDDGEQYRHPSGKSTVALEDLGRIRKGQTYENLVSLNYGLTEAPQKICPV